jgi:NADH-quinone oxidoreductase subunit I
MPIVKKKDLKFFEKTYIPQILAGMFLTLKQMFRPKFTRRYPEERMVTPAAFRGRPVLVMNDNGEERCVACGLCSRVCPSLAIEIQAAETKSEKERYPEKFEINMVRCIFCGFCEEVCPEEAIVMSNEYELVFNSQDEAIFGKDKLLVTKEKVKARLEFLKKYR